MVQFEVHIFLSTWDQRQKNIILFTVIIQWKLGWDGQHPRAHVVDEIRFVRPCPGIIIVAQQCLKMLYVY